VPELFCKRRQECIENIGGRKEIASPLLRQAAVGRSPRGVKRGRGELRGRPARGKKVTGKGDYGSSRMVKRLDHF